MIKKLRKQLMSAFLALTMVLGLGSVNVFAAEAENEKTQSIKPTVISTEDKIVQSRMTAVINTYFKFYNYVDTPSKYYSGKNITVTMSGIHSDGPGTFRVEVYKSNSSGAMISSKPESYSGTFDSNSPNSTITWGDIGPGYYIFRVKKLSGTTRQYIDSATFYTH